MSREPGSVGESSDGGSGALRARLARLGPGSLRGVSWGPLALLVVSVLAIATVIWGNLRGPGIDVRYFDAGPLSDYAIGTVIAFPEEQIYVVGMADGRLRAVDGRVESSGCSVRYLADDDRGRGRNPRAVAGVLEDPCTGDLWAVTGDALAGGEEPLRTPFVLIGTAEDGLQHVTVELVAASD
jgi:hypothetical protein